MANKRRYVQQNGGTNNDNDDDNDNENDVACQNNSCTLQCPRLSGALLCVVRGGHTFSQRSPSMGSEVQACGSPRRVPRIKVNIIIVQLVIVTLVLYKQ